MAIHRKILRWLENELTEGNLQLGQDLPDDQRIARAIGLGRSRTREGLKTLEDMDLVRLYSGKGKEIIAHLNEEPAMAAAEPLRLHMAVSRYPKRDLVQTHMLLEGWSVANIDPGVADFGEVDELLEEMQEGGHPIREFLDLYLDFHLELSRLANNELIAGLLIAIRQPTFDALLSLAGRVPLWSSTMERLNAENRAVLEAVKDADSATARNLMMNQMRGLFDEAGVDLDESAVALTGMPGTSDLRMFEPVDIEDDFGPFPEEGPSFGWGFGAERFGNAPGGAPVPSSGSQQARRDASQQSQQHYDGQQGQQEQQSNLPLSFGTASGRAAAAFTRPSEGAPAAQGGNNGASQHPENASEQPYEVDNAASAQASDQSMQHGPVPGGEEQGAAQPTPAQEVLIQATSALPLPIQPLPVDPDASQPLRLTDDEPLIQATAAIPLDMRVIPAQGLPEKKPQPAASGEDASKAAAKPGETPAKAEGEQADKASEDSQNQGSATKDAGKKDAEDTQAQKAKGGAQPAAGDTPAQPTPGEDKHTEVQSGKDQQAQDQQSQEQDQAKQPQGKQAGGKPGGSPSGSGQKAGAAKDEQKSSTEAVQSQPAQDEQKGQGKQSADSSPQGQKNQSDGAQQADGSAPLKDGDAPKDAKASTAQKSAQPDAQKPDDQTSETQKAEAKSPKQGAQDDQQKAQDAQKQGGSVPSKGKDGQNGQQAADNSGNSSAAQQNSKGPGAAQKSPQSDASGVNGSAGKDAASPKSGDQKAEKADEQTPGTSVQETSAQENPAQQKEPAQKDSVQNKQDAKAAPQKPAGQEPDAQGSNSAAPKNDNGAGNNRADTAAQNGVKHNPGPHDDQGSAEKTGAAQTDAAQANTAQGSSSPQGSAQQGGQAQGPQSAQPAQAGNPDRKPQESASGNVQPASSPAEDPNGHAGSAGAANSQGPAANEQTGPHPVAGQGTAQEQPQQEVLGAVQSLDGQQARPISSLENPQAIPAAPDNGNGQAQPDVPQQVQNHAPVQEAQGQETAPDAHNPQNHWDSAAPCTGSTPAQQPHSGPHTGQFGVSGPASAGIPIQGRTGPKPKLPENPVERKDAEQRRVAEENLARAAEERVKVIRAHSPSGVGRRHGQIITPVRAAVASPFSRPATGLQYPSAVSSQPQPQPQPQPGPAAPAAADTGNAEAPNGAVNSTPADALGVEHAPEALAERPLPPVEVLATTPIRIVPANTSGTPMVVKDERSTDERAPEEHASAERKRGWLSRMTRYLGLSSREQEQALQQQNNPQDSAHQQNTANHNQQVSASPQGAAADNSEGGASDAVNSADASQHGQQ